MAPLPVITDVYRVAFNWQNSVNSQIATNVMHFHKSGSNAAAVSAIIDAAGTASMFIGQSNQASITQFVTTPLDGTSVSFPQTPTSPAHWVGGAGTGDFVPQVAILLKLLTLGRGRSARGRVYLPFAAESVISEGALLTATKTSLNAAWIAFHTSLTASSLDWVVASYKNSTAANVAALGFENTTATQRRRLRRTSAV